MPEIRTAAAPQAFGDAMEVPFIRMWGDKVHFGTGAIAPPGAKMSTPMSPSNVGPRDVHA